MATSAWSTTPPPSGRRRASRGSPTTCARATLASRISSSRRRLKMAEKVGFVGLGIMGKPMARNLMEAGYDLTVHNRSRGPGEELASDGASAGGSPREVAQNSDVIITDRKSDV